MGWGGFLAGAGGAAAEIADKWITDEMEEIRARRVEEAMIRKEQREWSREDAQYARNRRDTLEDYEQKKKIDAKYREPKGGSGSKKDSYLYMTLENGDTVMMKPDDVDRMYQEYGKLGQVVADKDGNTSFVRGTIGGTKSSRGSASQADRYDDATDFLLKMHETYGEDGPPKESPYYGAYQKALSIASDSNERGFGGEPSVPDQPKQDALGNKPAKKTMPPDVEERLKTLAKQSPGRVIEYNGFMVKADPLTGEVGVRYKKQN